MGGDGGTEGGAGWTRGPEESPDGEGRWEAGERGKGREVVWLSEADGRERRSEEGGKGPGTPDWQAREGNKSIECAKAGIQVGTHARSAGGAEGD